MQNNLHVNSQSQPVSSYSTQAILSLVFGILGFLGFGPLTGIPALILGKRELSAIERKESPACNQSMATIGFLLGLILTAFFGLALLLLLFLILFFKGSLLPQEWNMAYLTLS